jgi:uncharacterized membrane protein YphA (DoxX/SURF4 family)
MRGDLAAPRASAALDTATPAGSDDCGVRSSTTSLARRLLFRFGVLEAVMLMLPWPINLLPRTQPLIEYYDALWELLDRGAGALLGVTVPPLTQTGSTDTTANYLTLLVQLVIGVVGAVVWSAIDERRHRTTYPRTATAVFTGLRYWLAFVMLGYGLAKVFMTQFPTPGLATLDHRIGDSSPMGLLWTFMGSSMLYAVFGGIVECVGAVLLLFRRTTTAGALVLIVVLVNVVMLNLAYDVPVKQFSSTLLIVSIVLAAPDLRRLGAVLLGHAVAARLPAAAPARSRRMRWLRAGAKLVVVAYVVVLDVLEETAARDEFAMRSALQGVYDVDSHVVDGVDDPLTDGTRWRRVIIEGKRAAVRTMADEMTRYRAETDEHEHSIRLTHDHDVTTFAYTRPRADRLELDGIVGLHHVHLALHASRRGPFLLMSREFSWIQESPFAR